MKAVLLRSTGTKDQLQYTDTPTPAPGKGQVLIEVKAAPVNYIDTIIRQGNMPPGMMPDLPFISGVEGSGVVVNANGSNLSTGKKVAYLGPIGASIYAEYAVVDADKLIVLPDSVDVLEAGAMPVTYFTAWHMLHNVARVEKGEYALVYAATGGVGTALVQLAKIAGLTVIALDRKSEKMTQALELGADHALLSAEGWTEEVMRITNGKGVKYIFNPVAGDTIAQDLSVLATLGHIVIFGFLAGTGTSNLQAEVVNHFSKAPTISYSEIYATWFNHFDLVKSSLEKVYALLAQGLLSPIWTAMPLREAGEAHELLETGKVQGKLILVP